MGLKLQQGQVWQCGREFIRIVQLERLSVDYKVIPDPDSREGTHQKATKKEFCRLIKGAKLLGTGRLSFRITDSSVALNSPANPAGIPRSVAGAGAPECASTSADPDTNPTGPTPGESQD